MREARRQEVQAGISPAHVAKHAFNAIKTDKFYMFTHREGKVWIQARMVDILHERYPIPPGL
jgi:hypothetical protein